MLYEILSPGEKIKKIRKDFKIKQYEITGGEITRELISIIENGKSKLTPSVAEIIAENVNNICSERNIAFYLTSSYLLEDINTQANKVADRYIECLGTIEYTTSKDFITIIKQIEEFLIAYDVPEKKLTIYEKIADIFKKDRIYDKSYIYYVKAYENYNKFFTDIVLFNLLQKMGTVCISLSKYREALDFNNKALVIPKASIPESLSYKAWFNNALAYKKLKEYDNCIKEIHNIEARFKNLTKQNKFKLNVLKANCFNGKKSYKSALELYKFLLDSEESEAHENIALVTNNIVNIYTNLNDIENTKNYMHKLIYLIDAFNDSIDSEYLCNIYNQIGETSKIIGNIDLAKKYYRLSINACKKFNNTGLILEPMDDFLSILINEDDFSEINKIKNEILELIKSETISSTNMIILKLINYYNDAGKPDIIQELLKPLLNEK